MPIFFFFGFESNTASAPSTAETHTDGAVIRKPGSAWLKGTPAVSSIFMFGFIIVVKKERKQKTQNDETKASREMHS